MPSPTPLEAVMEERKRKRDAATIAANRQSGANLLGMASNPGALLRGALDIPGSVYRYVRGNEPVEIGEDVSRLASDMAGDFRKDPVKFAVDMVNPMSSVQDFADVRALARDYRAAGDLDKASTMEQIAAMSPLAVVPVVGKVLGKGAKAAAKAAAKKAASLAVKPAKAAAERASLAVERGALNIKRDNPGGDWLKGKQEAAETVVRKRGNLGASGPVTAWSDAVSVDPAKLSEIPGSMGETPTPGNPKYDALLESMSKKGFDPKESGPLLVGINHRGEPHIIEGNNRAAVARDLGVKSVPAEFRWFAGGEGAGGFGPEHIEDMLSPVSKAHGGRVSPLAVKRKGKK